MANFELNGKKCVIPNVFELSEEDFDRVLTMAHTAINSEHSSPAILMTLSMVLDAFSSRVLMEHSDVSKEDAKETLKTICKEMMKCIDEM